MNLSDYKVTEQERKQHGVVSAPDTLTGKAQENKGVFDKLIGFFADKYNQLITRLEAFTAEQEAVNSAVSQRIATAQSTADTALTKANGGIQAAARAQATADGAVAVASVAQFTADSAAVAAIESLAIAAGIATTAQDALFTAKEAKSIAESVAIIYDPVTGLYVSVSEALQSIYNLVKSAPMTAQDFANNAITVDFLNSKKMTATELATRGKQILLGG